MKVTVLGAGVVGVVTAWYLARRGHAVTVIDAAEAVASGTSHANAGQLSYSFTDALAQPELLWKIPSLLIGRDAGALLKARPDPALLRWSAGFLRQCTRAGARGNTVAVLRLAMRSAELMEDLMNDVPLAFSFSRAGKLVLLRTAAELEAARASVRLKREHGSSTRLLPATDALQVEPALAALDGDFLAAIWSRDDHVGDARAFTEGLAAHLQATGAATFRLRERALSLRTQKDRVVCVVGDSCEHETDAVVVCLGADSPSFLRPLGVDLPICPVRGYSITLPPGESSPSVSVSDPGYRIVMSRLGDGLRIAGFADFVGFDTRHDEARLDTLLAVARRLAPLAADYTAGNGSRWAGFRPMTPDGRPRVGPTRVKGLWLNTGHGMLGWTLACATGRELAERLSRSADAGPGG